MIEANERLATAEVSSPIGLLTVVASECGIRAVLWPNDTPVRVRLPDTVVAPEHHVVEQTRRELEEYFAGTRISFDVSLDPVGTDFQQRAWLALRSIPFGETVSYGEQAARIGDKRMARAVGAANGKNPISIIVPCHRVVGSDGSLTGFAGGIDAKRFLLDHERRVAGHSLL
jgi:methylated-DNA-[protein]-cysteine S-methyltransferase